MSEEINFQQEDIDKCERFASECVDETWDRFKQTHSTRERRVFWGKLGELVFLKFLKMHGINDEPKDMFKVFKGTTNVDSMDFETKNGEKIDVKTAYESFHIRLLVPFDQFENGKAKDYYVGIKINLSDKKATIHGYCKKEVLEKNGKQDFGEGPAYWEYLDRLNDINSLISLMSKNLKHFFNTDSKDT